MAEGYRRNERNQPNEARHENDEDSRRFDYRGQEQRDQERGRNHNDDLRADRDRGQSWDRNDAQRAQNDQGDWHHHRERSYGRQGYPNADYYGNQGYRDPDFGPSNRSRTEQGYGQANQSYGQQSAGPRQYGEGSSYGQGSSHGLGPSHAQDPSRSSSGNTGYGGSDYGSQGYRSGGRQLGGSDDWRGGSGGSDWRRSSNDRSSNDRGQWSGGSWSLPDDPARVSRLYEQERDRSFWVNRVSSGSSNERQGYYGKGPKNYTRSDERIREDVCDHLSDDDEIDASEVTVTVRDGEVTLEGTVNDRRAKHRAEDIADNVRGVKDVHNRLSARKGVFQEIGDRITGKDDPHGHAGSGTKNTGAPLTTGLSSASRNGS